MVDQLVGDEPVMVGGVSRGGGGVDSEFIICVDEEVEC